MSDKVATPGCYQLILQLKKPARIQVGRLGRFSFPSGYYIYTGSAMNGLQARIARHKRKEKKVRWHIDYLLRRAVIMDVRLFPGEEIQECELNRMTFAKGGGICVAKKFGSSDCRCETHLAYFSELPTGRFDST